MKVFERIACIDIKNYLTIFLVILLLQFANGAAKADSTVKTDRENDEKIILKVNENLNKELGIPNYEAYTKVFAPLSDNRNSEPSMDLYHISMSPNYKNQGLLNPFKTDKSFRENLNKYYTGTFAKFKERALVAINGGPCRRKEIAAAAGTAYIDIASLNYFGFDNNLEGMLYLLAKKNDKALATFDFSLILCKNIAGDSGAQDSSLSYILSDTVKCMTYFQWLNLKSDSIKQVLNTLNSHKEFNNREFFHLGDLYGSSIAFGLHGSDAEGSGPPSTGLFDDIYGAVKSLTGDEYYTHVTLSVADTLINAYSRNNEIIKKQENLAAINKIIGYGKSSDASGRKYKKSKIPEIRRMIKKIADEEEYFNQKVPLLSEEDIKSLNYAQKIYIYSSLNRYYFPAKVYAPVSYPGKSGVIDSWMDINYSDLACNKYHLLKSAVAAKLYMKTKGKLPEKYTDLIAEGLVDEINLPFDKEIKFTDLYANKEFTPDQADKIVIKTILHNIQSSNIAIAINANFDSSPKEDAFRIIASGKNLDDYLKSAKDSLKFYSAFIEITSTKDNEIKTEGDRKVLSIDCKFKRPKSFYVAYNNIPPDVNPLKDMLDSEKKKYNYSYDFINIINFAFNKE